MRPSRARWSSTRPLRSSGSAGRASRPERARRSPPRAAPPEQSRMPDRRWCASSRLSFGCLEPATGAAALDRAYEADPPVERGPATPGFLHGAGDPVPLEDDLDGHSHGLDLIHAAIVHWIAAGDIGRIPTFAPYTSIPRPRPPLSNGSATLQRSSPP